MFEVRSNEYYGDKFELRIIAEISSEQRIRLKKNPTILVSDSFFMITGFILYYPAASPVVSVPGSSVPAVPVPEWVFSASVGLGSAGVSDS